MPNGTPHTAFGNVVRHQMKEARSFAVEVVADTMGAFGKARGNVEKAPSIRSPKHRLTLVF
jgi:hypothetical protein